MIELPALQLQENPYYNVCSINNKYNDRIFAISLCRFGEISLYSFKLFLEMNQLK